MTVVRMFGQTFQMCDKPHKPGEKYLRKAPAWVGNPEKCSARQREIGAKLTKAIHEAIKEYPADGTWANLQKIRKYVAERLRGEVVIPNLKAFIETYRIPKSAVAGHPLVQTAAKAYGVTPDEVLRKVAEVRPLVSEPVYAKVKAEA